MGVTPVEHDNNRSSALTPDQLALINTQTTATVQAVVKSMMSDIIGPMLKQMQESAAASALTPEKLLLLKAPYIDPKVAAREKRESEQTREQEAANIAMISAMRASCLHQDGNGKTAICVIHNYPDRQPRGVCPLCQDVIHPREWVIGAPDELTGKTKPYLRGMHKDYQQVLAIVARQG